MHVYTPCVLDLLLHVHGCCKPPMKRCPHHTSSGLYGYKVFVSLGLLLGDAVWNVSSIVIMSIHSHRAARKEAALPQKVCGVTDMGLLHWVAGQTAASVCRRHMHHLTHRLGM